MSVASMIEQKMTAAAQSPAAVRAFLENYRRLVAGETGLLPEETLRPVEELPAFETLPEAPADTRLLAQTVVIKLNGGLGTSMGLDRAKTLLPVKDGLNFLDLIARQILHLREGGALRFLLMNSFSTSEDSMKYLERYPSLGERTDLEFIQSKVPKIDQASLEVAESSDSPELEWCPPGHGDIYASLAGSGRLEELLADGIRYAFVSNADNLGATPDPRILQYFAREDASFLMEVTQRTEADRKGGHLAVNRSDERLVLRESAQCPGEDMEAFQDTGKHRYFNTNNLWMRLDRLRDVLIQNNGVFPLPIIRNEKTLDPKDKSSAKVYQLETAMGAAIEEFPDAQALVVPRSRFAPVKKTSDLMILRSDACEVRADWTLGLVADRAGIPPEVNLDDVYNLIADYERLAPVTPSLVQACQLKVRGAAAFREPIEVIGRVTITNDRNEAETVPAGVYRDTEITLPV